MSDVIAHAAIQACGGYLLGRYTGQEILGAKIGVISAVAELALTLLSVVIIKNTSRKTSHVLLLKALNVVLVGTATLTALVALKVTTDFAILATGVYYGFRVIKALVDANNMSQFEAETAALGGRFGRRFA